MTTKPLASAGGYRRTLILGLCAAALACLLPTDRAFAAEPVPCSGIGGGKYSCEWWRAGDGFSAGTMVVRHEGAAGSPLRIVGRLPQGTNWIVCQQQGATVHDSAGNRNNWYAWTEAEGAAGEWGWVSALDARGGTDFGMFGGGVPICTSPPAHGGPPSIEGLWGTTPPAAGSPSAPAPPAPPAAAPPAAPPSGPAPAVDHTLYRAGQWLQFDSGGGKQSCTAGFVLMWNDQPFGVSAAHCSGWDQWGKFRYGSAYHELGGSLERLGGVAVQARGDSLLFELTPGRYRQEIERGSRRPLRVKGFLGPESITAGTKVCFAGRASGADRCGTVTTRPDSSRACMSAPARPADSGGPVYTAARESGPVYAVGILSQNELREGESGQACFTAITHIMGSFACVDCVSFPVPTSGDRPAAPLVRQVDARPAQRRRHGLRIVARLSRRAAVTVRIRPPRSARWHTVRRRAHAGRSVLRIARLGGARLRRGRHQITVTARAGARRSTTWQLAVRLR